jgi:hypothetical protein
MSGPGGTSSTIRTWSVIRLAALALLTIALALTFLAFPEAIATTDLDESWVQSLGYFFKNQRQIGVDYVFTYGPLGFFIHRSYDADLFWHCYAWELIIKLLCAFCIAWVALRGPVWPWTLLVLALAAFVFEPGIPEALYYVSLLAAFIMVTDRQSSAALLVIGSLVIAVISLVKFTFLMYVAICLPFVEMAYRVKYSRAVFSPLVLVACFFAGAWLGAGQDLRNIPRYLWGSLQITAGYSEAMATPAGPAEFAFGLSVVIVLTLLVTALCWRSWPDWRRLAGWVMFLGCLLLAWKQGFTRGDPAHNNLFFTVSLFVAGFIPSYFMTRESSTGLIFAGAAGAMLISITGLSQVADLQHQIVGRPALFWGNINRALTPARTRHMLAERRADLQRTWRLPDMQATVGDAPIDMMSYEQGVLLLNGLNYVPRPVLHSYSAYTPYLLAKNAALYRSTQAPAFVLYRFHALDAVFPALADSSALLELLWRYRPIRSERSFLLLEKCDDRPSVARPAGRVILEKTIGFDQTLDLRGITEPYLTAALTIKPTFLGWLRRLAHRPGGITIEVELDSGERRTHRIVPAIAGEEFIIRPFLGDRDDVLRLYGGPGRDVKAFRVLTDSPASHSSEIAVKIRACPQLVGCPIDGDALKTLLAQPKELHDYEGRLDRVDSAVISGWARDRHMPEGAIEVDIYVDDTLVGVIKADENRGAGLGKHGFTFPTPEQMKDGRPHTVRVQPAGSARQLEGSPRNITIAPAD